MAADRLLFGDKRSEEPVRFTIAPDTHPFASSRESASRLTDQDVKRVLLALADRMGHIEINQRELQTALIALAGGTIEGAATRCPQCGFVFND